MLASLTCLEPSAQEEPSTSVSFSSNLASQASRMKEDFLIQPSPSLWGWIQILLWKHQELLRRAGL